MDNVQILVIEDDLEINQLLVKTLEKEGYSATAAYDGQVGIAQFLQGKYQMVILDLMLPKIEGTEVLRRIREKAQIPVLILSAKNEETDKILGLGLGADDYMTKPFSAGEFLARVKAQLRRFLYFSENSGANTKFLTYGELSLDPETYQVLKAGVAVTLTAKEFELLKLFMTNPHRVFTKSQLLRQVWDDEYSTDDNTVMVHIRRLRAKIEADPSEPKYIQTVWGIGYKLGEMNK